MLVLRLTALLSLAALLSACAQKPNSVTLDQKHQSNAH